MGGNGKRPPDGEPQRPDVDGLELSGLDQTLSDRDQQASDDDQVAADLDRDHGGDGGAHADSTSRRAARTQERDEISALRDLTAQDRDTAAIRRDALALLHDEVAETRDRNAAASDSQDTAADDAAQEVEDVRARARAGRLRAARDRQRALRDREQAAHDRRQAAHDRERAAYDRRQAGTDELTGARRRGMGLEELQSEIGRARRHGTRLAAVYIDIDGLEAVNDSEGHIAGDRLLRSVANALRDRMRSYDLLMRVGGDEFVCVLPGITADEARLRLHDLGPAGPHPWSVSLGVSVLRDADDPLTLIDRADRDLIARRGRG